MKWKMNSVKFYNFLFLLILVLFIWLALTLVSLQNFTKTYEILQKLRKFNEN